MKSSKLRRKLPDNVTRELPNCWLWPHLWTFGIFGDVTSTPQPGVPKASDPRFVSVAPPIAAFGGVRVKF